MSKSQENLLFESKNGSYIPIRIYCAPIISETGRAEGLVVVFTDISEQKQAEKERKELERKEQRELNRIARRNSFAALSI